MRNNHPNSFFWRIGTVAIVALLLLSNCQKQQSQIQAPGSYIFAWAKDQDSKDSDFLVVINAQPASPRYGRVVTSLSVDYKNTQAHHTEHRMHEGGVLFANGFRAGRTFMFDLNEPENPKLLGSFGGMDPYTYSHSFERLSNGNILATFQTKGEGNNEEGGLVELDKNGRFIRAASASAREIEDFIRPYSLAIVPELDRVVSSSADMRAKDTSRVVQVWRLSDLSLIKTILIPPDPDGTEGRLSAEPRVLQDRKTVIISTFHCRLYKLNGLAGEDPTLEWVHSFPYEDGKLCALPVVSGNYWVQTVPSIPALISLDISNPGEPVEVARLELGETNWPHWISSDLNGERLVVTGYDGLSNRLLIVNIDKQTGGLSFDKRFKEEGTEEIGINFERESWPHGTTGSAIPHGAVFSLK